MALLYHSLTLTVLLVNKNTIETKDKRRKKQNPRTEKPKTFAHIKANKGWTHSTTTRPHTKKNYSCQPHKGILRFLPLNHFQEKN
jgi:hypothetical protein